MRKKNYHKALNYPKLKAKCSCPNLDVVLQSRETSYVQDSLLYTDCCGRDSIVTTLLLCLARQYNVTENLHFPYPKIIKTKKRSNLFTLLSSYRAVKAIPAFFQSFISRECLSQFYFSWSDSTSWKQLAKKN